jgi:hypothetical protein
MHPTGWGLDVIVNSGGFEDASRRVIGGVMLLHLCSLDRQIIV